MKMTRYGPARNLVIMALVFVLFFVICILLFIAGYWVEGLKAEKDNPSLEDHADVLWTMKFDGKIVSASILSENTIYVQTTKSFSARDINTGNELWNVKLAGGSNRNAPFMLADDTIYASVNSDEIGAINAQTGAILWISTLEAENGDDTLDMYVQDETLYITKFREGIFALDRLTGEVKWKSFGVDRSDMWIYGHNNDISVLGYKEIVVFEKNNGELKQDITTDLYPMAVLKRVEADILVAWKESTHVNLVEILHKDTNEIERLGELLISKAQCITAYDTGILIAGNGISKFDFEHNTTLWVQSDFEELSCPLVKDNYIYVRELQSDLHIYSFLTGKLLNSWNLYSDPTYAYEFAVDPLITDQMIILQTTKNSLSAVQIRDLLIE